MSDYRVKVTVRNARLLRAIEQAGHRPGEVFATLVGVNYSSVLLPYLNLTRSPIDEAGLLRECAWALCDFLNASPSDLWSDDQLIPLKKNSANFDLDANGVMAIMNEPSPESPMQVVARSEVRQAVEIAFADRPRLLEVLRLRFFQDMSLEETAKEMGVSRDRIRQLEGRALRTLRHPKNAYSLKDALELLGPSSKRQWPI